MNLKKISTILLLVLLATMFIVPVVSAAPAWLERDAAAYEVTAWNSLGSLAVGIGELFKGNIDGFVVGLLGAFPVVAVFLLVFALMRFVAHSTIFRSEDDLKHSNLLAIGFALIAVGYPVTFSFIFGFFGVTGITILFILAFVFLIWQFFTHQRTNSLKDSSKRLHAKRDNLEIRKDVDKVKHDEKIQDKYQYREKKDINNIEKTIRNDISETRNAKVLIQQMREALARLENPAYAGTSTEIKNKLVSQHKHLHDSIMKEHKDVAELWSRLKDIKKLEFKEFNLEHDEEKHLEDMKKRFAEGLESFKAKPKTKIINEMETFIKNKISLQNDITALISKEEQLVKDANMEDNDILTFLSKLSSALELNVDTDRASQDLMDIDNYLGKLNADEMQLKNIMHEIENLERRKHDLNEHEKSLENKLKRIDEHSTSKGVNFENMSGFK